MALRVDTSVPYGNACEIEIRENADPPEIRFAADPHGGPECLWFCFRVLRTSGPVGTVRLVEKHFPNILGNSDPTKVMPVVRSAGGDWERAGRGELVGLPDGRWEAAWTVTVAAAYADVAVSYPYGRPEVRALLDETGGRLRADVIGVSQCARPLVRLSNSPGEPGSTRPGVYLVARQHSGEVPGTWVLDGMLRRLAAMGDDAPLVWAVPLTNVDGVEQGDYGKDNFPWDLNRAWGSPPMRHEVLVFQRDMLRWRERCRPVLGLDLHAPSACEAAGLYVPMPDPDEFPDRFKRATQWTDVLRASLGDYAAQPFAQVHHWGERWHQPTFQMWCFGVLDMPGLCVEIPYAMAGETVLTRERYREIGERMASAIAAS